MRSYLAAAPVWVMAVLQGVTFAVTQAVFFSVQDGGLKPRIVIITVITGIAFGVTMAFVGRRQRRATDPAFRDLSTERRRAVFRAVFTGRPPEDAALRDAAVAVLHDWADRQARSRVLVIAVATVLAVASVGFAATNPWWFVVTTGFVWMIVWTLRYPVTLRRRAAAFASLDVGTRRPTVPGRTRL
jgi:hypothetical protein